MKLPYRSNKRDNKKGIRITPRTAAWIVVIIALIVAVAVSTGLTGKKTNIQLPTGSAESVRTAESEQQSFTLSDADITVDNVQQVISDLRRPEAYSMAIKNTVYWDTDWSECQVNMYARNDVYLTEYFNTTQEVDRYEMIDGDKYYSWRTGRTEYHTGKNGNVTADQNSMMPTYETIAVLDKDSITEAGIRMVNNEPCIFCVVNDKKSGYMITYYVSSVTGLLMQADYTQDTTLVRSVIVTAVDSNAPDENKFTLPNGMNVITGLMNTLPSTTTSSGTTDSTTAGTTGSANITESNGSATTVTSPITETTVTQ